jgi:hypothetical protein
MSNYDTPNAAEMYFNRSIFGHLYAAIAGVPPLPRKDRQARGHGRPVARAANGAATPHRTLVERLDGWFWRKTQEDREAYLAEASDVFDLEQRIDAIERGVVTPHG